MESILENVASMMAPSARQPQNGGAGFRGYKDSKRKGYGKAGGCHGRIRGKTGKSYDRDARGIRDSGAVLLLSLNEALHAGLNCGACGFEKCNQLQLTERDEFAGPVCAWRLVDLGIALGSAVKTAGIFNADNRIMYRVGVIARREELIQGEIVIGVPLAASGKNIFFDR